MHHTEQVPGMYIDGGIEHLPHGREDQCKGGTEYVRDVCKKTGLQRIELMELLCLEPGHLELEPRANAPELCPPRGKPRGDNHTA